MHFLGTPDVVHGSRPRIGVLLVNLGTPADPSPRSVRKYLAEFLSDPRVISWGRMLHEAHSFGAFAAGAWWLLIPPGTGISILCLAFLDVGKHLEETADPRLRRART